MEFTNTVAGTQKRTWPLLKEINSQRQDIQMLITSQDEWKSNCVFRRFISVIHSPESFPQIKLIRGKCRLGSWWCCSVVFHWQCKAWAPRQTYLYFINLYPVVVGTNTWVGGSCKGKQSWNILGKSSVGKHWVSSNHCYPGQPGKTQLHFPAWPLLNIPRHDPARTLGTTAPQALVEWVPTHLG